MLEGIEHFISLYCTSALEQKTFGVFFEVVGESSHTTLLHAGDFRVVASSHPAVQKRPHCSPET